MKKLLYTLAAVFVSNIALAQQTQNTNKNYVKSTSYQVPVQNETEINALPQSDKFENITYYDGLGRPEQSIALRQGGKADIANELTYDWESGNIGSTAFFIKNGSNAENRIINGTTPYGDTDLLWECHNQDEAFSAVTSSRPDGGWNTQYFAVDKTVGYRYSVWVKREHSVTDGRTYHGTKNVSDLNGVPQSNPYFYVSYGANILPQVDTWYLMVGIIHPFDYSGGNTGESGVYDMQGNKILNGNEFKWNPDTTVSRFRNYLYYTEDTNVKQYLYKPLLQRLDGQELSLPQLTDDNFIKDIVSPVVYDDYGRQTKEYLPHAELTFGDYTPNDQIISTAENYYTTTYSDDLNASAPNIYSEKHLEASPLGRLLEQAAPGNDWKLDTTSDTDHTIKFEYDTNDASEVPYYTVIFPTGNTEEPQLFYNGNYQENQLYKSITKDENWTSTQIYDKDHTTEEFKNKQGQVILKRTYSKNVPHDTQYVYDDFGNLTFVLSPNGSDAVIYDSNYPNYSRTSNYVEIVPSNNKGAPVTLGEGNITTIANNATQDISITFNTSFYNATALQTGPVIQLTQSIPDVIIGTLSGNDYNYIVSVQNGYIYLSGSGDVTSLNQTLTTTLPSQSIDPEALNNLGYQYHYDYRNRLVEKKIPGKGWEYIIYDKLDRPVLTQDATQRLTNDWLFTKYDAFNRVVYTGIYNAKDKDGNVLDRDAVLNTINNQTVFNESRIVIGASAKTIGDMSLYYSNSVFPLLNIEVLTVNYYDDYPQDITNETNNVGVFILAGQDNEISPNTKTLATGSKVRVLGTNDWIISVTYYDDKARPIYVESFNQYLDTRDVVKSALDFLGKVLETQSEHTKNGTTITTNDMFTYDHANRLLTQTQIINQGVPELIVNNAYDDLGQLVSKKVGGVVASAPETSAGLQSVDYSYNIRGWLKEINDVDNMADDLFSFKLNYNTQEGSVQLGKLYNGNISQSIWRTAFVDANVYNTKRGYSYSYDALNRIEKGILRKGNGLGSHTGYDLSRVSYDKNGNILQLTRDDQTTTMDDLLYNYQGNQLIEVNDLITSYTNEGFKDGNTVGDDYVYDVNGNMIEDKNKDITEILYNHLNLPKKVTFNNDANKNIEYIYDATGVKQAKVVKNEEDITTTKYAGNFIYEETGAGDNLKFFSHPEGYLQPDNAGGFDYVYQFKDHLGNIRLSYSDTNGNGDIDAQNEIIEENNYYPFGLKHKGYNDVVSAFGDHPYGFGGKEEQNELGLGWMDVHARNYNPELGRWMNIDPLAHQFPSFSTYNYAFNNPINFIDSDGKAPDPVLLQVIQQAIHNAVGKAVYVRAVEAYNNVFSDISRDKYPSLGSVPNTKKYRYNDGLFSGFMGENEVNTRGKICAFGEEYNIRASFTKRSANAEGLFEITDMHIQGSKKSGDDRKVVIGNGFDSGFIVDFNKGGQTTTIRMYFPDSQTHEAFENSYNNAIYEIISNNPQLINLLELSQMRDDLRDFQNVFNRDNPFDANSIDGKEYLKARAAYIKKKSEYKKATDEFWENLLNFATKEKKHE